VSFAVRQRAVPAITERLGFHFRYARLDEALGAIFDRFSRIH
jgi:NAD dependent epimerase/dehydratase family enzyme